MKTVEVLNELADSGVYIIAGGLNLNFKAEPFPVMGELPFRADNVVYFTAVCAVCGRPEMRSQRLIDRSPLPGFVCHTGRWGGDLRGWCKLHHEIP